MSASTSSSIGWSKPWPRGRIAAITARRMRVDGIGGRQPRKGSPDVQHVRRSHGRPRRLARAFARPA
jgi:hypothetical protein